MDDLIKREAALEALEQVRWSLWNIDIPSPTVPEYIEHHKQVQEVMAKIYEMCSKMEALPSAEKIGRWTDRGSISCRCSECGCKSPKEFNFCPNCGARMKK